MCWISLRFTVRFVLATTRKRSTTFEFKHTTVMHPGGSKILTDLGGTDATEKFWALHKQEILLNWAPRLKVGTIEDADAEDIDSLGEISNVPFAEHIADIGNDTPYYTDSHIDFRQEVRDWVYTALFRSGIAEKHESNGERPPDSLFEEMGQKGILAARLGPGKHLKVWQEKVMHDSNATIFGVKPEEFDYFHERILHEEIVRCACPGFVAGIGDGHCIGAPPIFQFVRIHQYVHSLKNHLLNHSNNNRVQPGCRMKFFLRSCQVRNVSVWQSASLKQDLTWQI